MLYGISPYSPVSGLQARRLPYLRVRASRIDGGDSLCSFGLADLTMKFVITFFLVVA